MTRLPAAPERNATDSATVVSNAGSSGSPESRAESPAIGPQNHSR